MDRSGSENTTSGPNTPFGPFGEDDNVYSSEDRIKAPWRYETDRLFAEPPDINYRAIILEDEERVKDLLQDPTLHFTERCLLYQKLDVLLEDDLLSAYLDWNTERLYTSKLAKGKEKEAAFFEGLRIALSEDVKMVEDEIRQHRHEEGLRQGETDRQSHGKQQFFHVQNQCWYFYDERMRQWQEEPTEEGYLYEKRREKWREESFYKLEQRYFDCVERRFYQYTPSDQKWHAQWPPFARWHAMFFTWDKTERTK